LYFREAPPKAPDFLQILAQMRGAGRSLPALPAPQSRPAETPAAEEESPRN
jgi:hypothetical protein